MWPAGVMVAQGTPNALVGVRFPGGTPSFTEDWPKWSRQGIANPSFSNG